MRPTTCTRGLRDVVRGDAASTRRGFRCSVVWNHRSLSSFTLCVASLFPSSVRPLCVVLLDETKKQRQQLHAFATIQVSTVLIGTYCARSSSWSVIEK